MKEGLSRLIAGLVEQAKKGEDLSPGISRVRLVVKKVIEGEDTMLGKLYALVDSFRDVIRDEKQRYHAAIKALSATSRLSPQEIVSAINAQHQELKLLEKIMTSALPHGTGELRALEARSQKVKNEISGLREKIAQLEKEEKEMADSMAGREKETAVIEKAMREVFTEIGAEITSVKKNVEELYLEAAAQHPVPAAEIKTGAAGERQSRGQKSLADQISSHPAASAQKTCPLCGGQMSFSMTRKIWQCFSCSHEELERDEAQSKSLSTDTIFPEPTPGPEPKKKCRMCGGRMDYYIAEKKWQCFSCASEESENDQIQSKKEELRAESIFPEQTPVSEQKHGREKNEQEKTPEPEPDSELKQKCSMCGGRMDYYAADSKWQCYSCGFEYFKKEESRSKSEEKRGEKNEEKSGNSNVLLAVSPAEPLFDLSSAAKSSPGYWESKKTSPKRPPLVTKTCPSCRKRMQSLGTGKGWACSYCGYERRI